MGAALVPRELTGRLRLWAKVPLVCVWGWEVGMTHSKATAGVGCGEPSLEGGEGHHESDSAKGLKPQTNSGLKAQPRVDPELWLNTDLEAQGHSGRWMFAAGTEVGLQ